MTDPHAPDGLGRRRFLGSAGLIGAGLAVGGTAGALGDRASRGSTAAASPAPGTATASETVSFYGPHQPGIVGRQQANLRFSSYDLTPTLTAASLKLLLQKLSTAAAAMMAGHWIAEQGDVADGMQPANLSVTFGFGHKLITLAGRAVPAELVTLPAFAGDALQPGRIGGDLSLQVCAEDPLVVASAARALTRVGGASLVPRWTQTGFSPSTAASTSATATPRNLLGQLDGTDNPTGARLDIAVWAVTGTGADWMSGGSYLVSRRIRMLLDSWQDESTTAKELVIGRRLVSGAPLSGGDEHTPPVFTRQNADGTPAIPADAHVRLTHPANNTGATMLRRGYSYDEGLRSDGQPEAGLFFQAFQADPRQVFVSIQRKLAASDALNRFIRHEGSAVFAIPPGASAGGWVGETLFG